MDHFFKTIRSFKQQQQQHFFDRFKELNVGYEIVCLQMADMAISTTVNKSHLIVSD